ncbi:MAG: cell division protein FtsL [Burkholderiaceae bacterium]
MNRLSALLLAALVLCALGLVTSQYRSRVLFAELERAKAQAGQLEVRYDELEHEQTKLANAKRIHGRASGQLALRARPPQRTMHLMLDDETRLAAREAAMRWRADATAQRESQ